MPEKVRLTAFAKTKVGGSPGSQNRKAVKKVPIEATGMRVTTEIAPSIYPISILAQRNNLRFNHFLVKDDELLLLHTGWAECTRRRPLKDSRQIEVTRDFKAYCWLP